MAENITGGTVSANPTTAAANATVTLTATPATGYEFGTWDVKDANSNSITVTDNKFTMPAANVTVSATFNAIEVPDPNATTATWVAGEQGYENGTQYTSAKVDSNISLAFGDGGNDGKYYDTGTGIRIYAKGKVTVAAKDGCTMSKIVLTYDGTNTGNISASTGNYTLSSSTGTWKGTASSVVLTNTATSGHARIQSITVTYTGEGTPDPEPTYYSVTIAEGIANGSVTASAENAAEGDVITLTATPAGGYVFDAWNVKGADNSTISVTDNKFNMPAADVIVSATFKADEPEPEPTIGESETYEFAAFEQANDVTIEAANYTVTLHKNTGSTAPQWNASAAEARVYAKGSVDISSELNIVKVVYDYTVNANNKGNMPTIDGAAGATNAGNWNAETKTWTGCDKTISLTTSGSAGNLGFKNITVYFEEGVTVYKALHLVAKNDDGYYATFSSSDVTFFTDDYVVSAVGVENGELYQFDNEEAFDEDIRNINSDAIIGYYVPANTGVLVYSDDPIVKYLTVSDVTPSTDVDAVNMLRPASEPMTGAYSFYKLAYDDYEAKTGLGFYWGAENDAAFTCKAGTAYLAVPTDVASNLRGFSFEDEGCITGIKAIATDKANNTSIYNLQGQRVVYPEHQSKGLQQGVNIVNGKKVIR